MPEMTFLNWDQPLLTKLVKHLLDLKDDVVNKIIIVPTMQSGRQLRKALAEAGVGLSPRVVTPDILLPTRNPGNRVAEITAWTQVLLNLNLDDARGLFPKDPPAGVIHSFRWAFNVAKQLNELQQNLRDNGKTFQEISRRSIESERWSDLAKLNERVTQTIRKWRIKNPEELEAIPTDKQLIIAGVCDLSSLAIARLEDLSDSNISIEIIVHATEKHRPHFDSWGRPLADYWSHSELPLSNWKKNVTVTETPSLAAKHLVDKIAADDLIPEQITLGLCDRDMALSIQQEFTKSGWKIYDPEGANLRSSSFILFLTSLGEWLNTNAMNPTSAFAKLVRLPEMETFITEDVDRYILTRELDQCLEKRLPVHGKELNQYLQTTETDNYPHLKQSLNHFLLETEKMLSGNKIKGLRGWIAKLLNRTQESIAEILVNDIADIMDTLENIEKYSDKSGVDIKQVLEILTEVISNKKYHPDKEGSIIDLLGWIELVYEDAPELFLTGLHEGHVPKFSGDDPFLPNTFREMLDMDNGDIHYARDSYLFQSFIESRENIHITLSKLNESNEPKTPSRLLLRTSGKELAERVRTFFGDPHLESKNPSAWQRDWQLTIPEIQNPYSLEHNPPRSLSPTALRDYLHCPFRFFLKRIVRMNRYEAKKNELNALDFGLLVHSIVEKFGKDESMRDNTSAKEIQHLFDNLLEKEIFLRYGGNPNLAITMQAEIAKSRLHRLAILQAEETASGWRIIDVELDIGKNIKWDIAGHPIKMQIDRVDQHQQTGEIRVMDYKTSAKATDPLKAHIDNFKPDENRPLCDDLLPPAGRGKIDRRWKNLQLPIYAWFAQHHYKSDEIPSIGYIQLPNTLSEAKFTIWDEFNEDLLRSAKKWTISTIEKIQKNNFYQPANLPNREANWDEFSKLAQGSIAEAFGLT